MKKMVLRILLILGIILISTGIIFTVIGIYKKITLNIPNPVVTIEVENYGTIKLELYPDKAPNTVSNFIRLANRGFYNGTTFHRTMPNFVIQGGAKDGDTTASPTLSDLYDLDNVLNDKKTFESILEQYYNGEFTLEDDASTVITSYSEMKSYINENENGKSYFEKFLEQDYSIPGEFIANDHEENNVKHEAGVISMARSDYSSMGYTTEGYNSAGCQFFIMTEDNSSLDGVYAAFGKVTEGMDVVEKIANVEVYYRDTEVDENFEVPEDENGNQIASDTPKEQPVITSISVETYGVDYGVPDTVVSFDPYSMLLNNYQSY